jgi:hypothetical protein
MQMFCAVIVWTYLHYWHVTLVRHCYDSHSLCSYLTYLLTQPAFAGALITDTGMLDTQC